MEDFVINSDGVLTEYRGKGGNVVIPDGVKRVGAYSFYCRKEVRSVIIPNSVESIGACAFGSCSSLTSLTIGNGVMSIEWCAFSFCKNLTSVTIGNGVTSIGFGEMAFYGASLFSKESFFKAFSLKNNKIQCRNYIFEEGVWSKDEPNIKLCRRGYHFCTNLFEIFDFCFGEIDKDIVIYECEIGDKVICQQHSSLCVTNKIKPVRRLSREEIIRLLNTHNS